MKRQAIAFGTDGQVVASGVFDTDDVVENPDGSYTVTISRHDDGPISSVMMTGSWSVTDA
jgi:hypothetical protein